MESAVYQLQSWRRSCRKYDPDVAGWSNINLGLDVLERLPETEVLRLCTTYALDREAMLVFPPAAARLGKRLCLQARPVKSAFAVSGTQQHGPESQQD